MKDKLTIVYLILISVFLLSMLTLFAYAETEPTSSARSHAVYDPDTRTFLHGKNLGMRLPMASTTKIVTALLAIERLDPNEIIRVPIEAVGTEGSSLYLSENDEISVIDLIYALMLRSANDAAVTLALRMAPSIEDFADMMNTRVKEMGAENTNFENPHGLDSENHYTTAEDLAIIAAAALKDPVFRTVCATKKHTFKLGEGTRVLINHNKLLALDDSFIGVKTGYTKKCGRCLVSAAIRNDKILVCVTLSDPDDWRDHKTLLNYGFSLLEKRGELEYNTGE